MDYRYPRPTISSGLSVAFSCSSFTRFLMHASHSSTYLTFLRVHSPPPAPLPVLPKLRSLIVGSYPHTSRFLAALSLFPSLSSLRILNLSMHNQQSALSCPPSLKCLQICNLATPLLPDSLRFFSSLTRLDVFQCVPLRALPSFLSSFSSLSHFSFECGPVVVPVCLEGYIEGKTWAREEEGRKGWRFQSAFEGSSLSAERKEEQREFWRQVGEEEEEEEKQQVEEEVGERGAWVLGVQEVGLRGSTKNRNGKKLYPPSQSQSPPELLPPKVLSPELLPPEVLPPEALPPEALPPEVSPQHGQYNSSSANASTPSSVQLLQLPPEVVQHVLQRLQGPSDQAAVRGVCREWRRWCRLHTSTFALALHPLLLSWVPLALIQPPPAASSLSSSLSPHSFSSAPSSRVVCRSGSRRGQHGTTSLNTSPRLPASSWDPAESPFWLIHSSPPTCTLSLLPSSPPPFTFPHPFTIPPPIPPSSLSSCFTHHPTRWQPLSPIWFASLPSPSSLARTLSLYPALSALALPLVSTAALPLHPSHVRSLLSAAAAQPALTSLSLLLEDGFRGSNDWGYGRGEWLGYPGEASDREKEMRHWWDEANREVEGGLLAVMQRCRGLKELHLQGETLAKRLRLPHSLFRHCPQLTALSLPLSRLPSSLLHLSHLTSLSLAFPLDHMPPHFACPSPFAHLRSLRSLSLHVRHIRTSYERDSTDGSRWRGVSDDLFLGLNASSLASLSLDLPTGMPASFSCLTGLSSLNASQGILGLEEIEEGGVGEEEEEEEAEGEEEREEEGEEEEGGEEDDDVKQGSDCSSGLGSTDMASRLNDERLLPLCNLTSLSLPHYHSFPPLVRHLTRLTSLSLPSLNLHDHHRHPNAPPLCSLRHGLSRLTRLQELYIGCSNVCEGSESACLPRLPRLRRIRVQCPDETVNIGRLIAKVAGSLEQLDVQADCRNYSSGNLTRTVQWWGGNNHGTGYGNGAEWTCPVFRKLKVLQLATSGPASRVDMALLPALEHMACARNRSVAWGVEHGFSANLRFLHLDSARISGYDGDPQLTQLTSLTTLVVENADCRDFLACLSALSSLRTLRLSNLLRGFSEPYLTYPPLLATLQICRSDLPYLPASLVKFACLTRLDLLHWRCLHSLPPFLSSFTLLRHFRVSCNGPRPSVPACLGDFLRGRDWYEHSACDGSFSS
ncbi:hypothetical protein CLOM_g10888 [Closterium sp. NIES-68]|nr:hypothetical protein CLOM_g10888 [Closterium sp. NIES-68]GJP74852.1 hypothetical protein CLOP_g5381 [Closterium sp. NIES-67]